MKRPRSRCSRRRPAKIAQADPAHSAVLGRRLVPQADIGDVVCSSADRGTPAAVQRHNTKDCYAARGHLGQGASTGRCKREPSGRVGQPERELYRRPGTCRSCRSRSSQQKRAAQRQARRQQAAPAPALMREHATQLPHPGCRRSWAFAGLCHRGEAGRSAATARRLLKGGDPSVLRVKWVQSHSRMAG